MTEVDLVMCRHELFEASHAADYHYAMYKGDDNHTRILTVEEISQRTPTAILNDAGLTSRPVIFISDDYHIGDLVLRIDIGIVIAIDRAHQTLTIATARGAISTVPAESTMLVVRAEDLLAKYEDAFVNYALNKEGN